MRRLNIPFIGGLLPIIAAVIAVVGIWVSSTYAVAGDLPVADGSPLAGVAFDDKPLVLPVQRNFQMAMLTSSSELGRSCGAIEAYGWRLDQSEQGRVNQIFNATVDKMRAQGFVVETKTPQSVSKDITLFTADRDDKNLLFMWSAGEIGLVVVMCETSAPLSGRLGHLTGGGAVPSSSPRQQMTYLTAPPSVLARDRREAQLPQRHAPASAVEGLHSALNQSSAYPTSLSMTTRDPARGASSVKGAQQPHRLAAQSLIGEWVGDYSCTQGTTGGTLSISSMKGNHFAGEFKFYPTLKNPYVPSGSYAVSGDFDAESQRILINPGKWIKRPPHFYNTIIIGRFDGVTNGLSAYFQGVSGCTSFEAHKHDKDDLGATGLKSKKNADQKKTTKKQHKRSDVLTPEEVSASLSAKMSGAKSRVPVDPTASIALPTTSPMVTR